MKGYLFYNHHLGDVLMIAFNIDQTPTHYQKKGDITLIYHHDELIGVNVFNISSVCKIKSSGQIHLPPKILIEVLNNLLNSSNIVIDNLDKSLYSIGKVESKIQCENMFLLKVNMKNRDFYVLSKNDVDLNKLYVIATEGALLTSGKVVKNFLYQNYLIEGHICSYLDLQLDSEDKLIILDDNSLVGEDFFSY